MRASGADEGVMWRHPVGTFQNFLECLDLIAVSSPPYAHHFETVLQLPVAYIKRHAEAISTKWVAILIHALELMPKVTLPRLEVLQDTLDGK